MDFRGNTKLTLAYVYVHAVCITLQAIFLVAALYRSYFNVKDLSYTFLFLFLS